MDKVEESSKDEETNRKNEEKKVMLDFQMGMQQLFGYKLASPSYTPVYPEEFDLREVQAIAVYDRYEQFDGFKEGFYGSFLDNKKYDPKEIRADERVIKNRTKLHIEAKVNSGTQPSDVIAGSMKRMMDNICVKLFDDIRLTEVSLMTYEKKFSNIESTIKAISRITNNLNTTNSKDSKEYKERRLSIEKFITDNFQFEFYVKNIAIFAGVNVLGTIPLYTPLTQQNIYTFKIPLAFVCDIEEKYTYKLYLKEKVIPIMKGDTNYNKIKVMMENYAKANGYKDKK